MKNVKRVLLASLFILFTISFATEPLPAPNFKYNISGTLITESQAERSNYTVKLFGKITSASDVFFPIEWKELEGNQPIDLTDSLGCFNLITMFYGKLDSIKIGVIQPHSEIMFSEAYWLDTLRFHANWIEYKVLSESGCSSCSVQPQSDYTTQRRIERYDYYLGGTEIHIP